MGTGLGYGAGLNFRQTVRNNDSGTNILLGQVVKLVNNSFGTAGVGDAILLGVLSDDAANDAANFGIAERDILSTGVAGEGEWGHVVVVGMVLCRAVTDIDAGDALVTDAAGNVAEASAANIAAGLGIGVALETFDGSVTAATGLCYVNFFHRYDATGSGYGGTAP
jgi:predicted RecA/RadA family phage recombinase